MKNGNFEKSKHLLNDKNLLRVKSLITEAF